ncbi:MAG: DUF1549 domain-containing protein [Planctomycetota bacterium]|nr:DUF1549 domain-containing protein [Planctomycetota bacterium]MDA1249579.1 DUF1549 domain-containing protein [Planctomycetota bacterium]
MRLSSAVLAMAAILAPVVPSRILADDLLPADSAVETVIDHYVDALLSADKVEPAAQVDDLNLLRRLMLDLAGRIPTTVEAKQFRDDQSQTKRQALVDQLLASPDFAFHHRNELDRELLPDNPGDGDFRKYLLWAAQQNRPWNQMFEDMVVGDESDEYQKAGMQFLRTRVGSVDDLTNDTSILFFGVNVSCAQCHDHPLADDWKQDHYFGMQSFFSRTYLTKSKTLAEKFYGDVKFKTTKGVEKQARFMFLNGSVSDEPDRALSDDERKKLDEEVKTLQKDDNAKPRKPDFSPRSELVKLALNEEGASFFARNIANRVWNRLFGQGIVHPPDQLHSGNPASHPQLLKWLARDLRTHDYDLKRLIRGTTLSRAYSRSSRWESDSETPAAYYFALAQPRILTPRQYSISLFIASQNPPHWDQWASKPPEDWAKEREKLEQRTDGWFRMFEPPTANYQVPVDEALLFSNSSQIQDDLLRDSADRLLGHLKGIDDPSEAIDAAFWAIVSRPPTDVEKQSIREYLKSRTEDRSAAMKQVLWALISGPEVRFNY